MKTKFFTFLLSVLFSGVLIAQDVTFYSSQPTISSYAFGGGTDVVTISTTDNPVHEGSNSLKLYYQPVDWWVAALFNPVGAVDLTGYTHISMWINTPNSMNKNMLPRIKFYSNNPANQNSPFESKEVYIGAALPGDLTPNQWTLVKIPISTVINDYAHASTIDRIVFLNNWKNTEPVNVYFNNIVVTKEVAPPVNNDKIIFSDSPNSEYLPTSNAQQNITLANGSFIPVVSSPVHSGTNALKFNYTEGYWNADVMVASMSNSWVPQDLSGTVAIEFWTYSPVAVDAGLLPKIMLKDGTDKEITTLFISTSLPAETWTKITLAVPSTLDLTSVKSLSFVQNNYSDAIKGKTIALYVDDIAAKKTTTSLDRSKVEQVKAYYDNSSLFIPGYNGTVKIYSVNGNLIIDNKNFNGIAVLSLDKGFYVVSTEKGSAKLLVR